MRTKKPLKISSRVEVNVRRGQVLVFSSFIETSFIEKCRIIRNLSCFCHFQRLISCHAQFSKIISLIPS